MRLNNYISVRRMNISNIVYNDLLTNILYCVRLVRSDCWKGVYGFYSSCQSVCADDLFTSGRMVEQPTGFNKTSSHSVTCNFCISKQYLFFFGTLYRIQETLDALVKVSRWGQFRWVLIISWWSNWNEI